MRILNSMAMSVDLEVPICLDGGSTPPISIRDNEKKLRNVDLTVVRSVSGLFYIRKHIPLDYNNYNV